jgi:penicillin-binding protein 2
MANVMCIVANRGFYYTPHIIKKIGKSDEHAKKFKTKNYTSVAPEIFDLVYDGMQDVVERGTAAGAKVPGIAILGKTGTAQNPHGKDHSLFVAFAPRENPKIAIGLMVENGGWGASWAAPIGTLMIEKYLNDTVIRAALEKRMMDGVVYPPHYKKEAGIIDDKEISKKDSAKKILTVKEKSVNKADIKVLVKKNNKDKDEKDNPKREANKAEKKLKVKKNKPNQDTAKSKA